MRTRVWLLVLVPLGLALLAAGAWARLLLVQVAAVGVSETAPREAFAAALWTWLLGLAAIGVLAAALGLILARLWILQPLRALARELPPAEGDEWTRLADTLAQLRTDVARDEAHLQDRLGAVDAMRGAAAAALARLQEADRLALVGRVALGVAHEVGGPLAIVVASLELWTTLEQSGAPLADRLRCLERAELATQRIQRILQELSQPGMPRRRDDDRPCDLADVARRTVQLAELHPRCRRVQLIVQASEPTHAVLASASQLEQVVLNLVLNACDALGGHGHVALQIATDGAWHYLHVDDDGPGIPAAERERVFEAFYSSKGPAGWGLGLSVSRRMVEQDGGSLTVATSPLGGARFTLRLPVPRSARRLHSPV